MFLQKNTDVLFKDTNFFKNSGNFFNEGHLDPCLLEFTRGHRFELPRPTGYHLKKAVLFLKQSSLAPQSLVFAGTDELVNQYIASAAAIRSQQAYTSKWTPGLLGNWESCVQRIYEYQSLEKKITDLSTSHFRQKKSPQTLLEDRNYSFYLNRMKRLSLRWEGLSSLDARPSVLVNLSGSRLTGASKEAAREAIPVIALVDWETRDLEAVNYPIPCDTRNTLMVTFISNVLSSAISSSLDLN
jgi:ribosomal protein S2